MPQTETAPDTEKQTIQGPDQKWYKVKKSDMPKFDQSFIKKGFIKKGDKWYTQDGEEAKLKVPSAIPAFAAKNSPTGLSLAGGTQRVGVTLQDKRKGMESNNAAKDYLGSSLPTVGGAIGGHIGGPLGAGIGGAGGQVLKDILVRPSFLELDPSVKKQVLDVGVEGAKQAGLDYVGGKAGDLFFKMLSKVTTSTIKGGIRFLPSEYKPGGTVYRYMEDLLGNLLPSAKIMQEFKDKQFKEIMDKSDTIIKGLAGTSGGTSEDVGVALQGTLSKGKEAIAKQLKVMREAYIKKGFSAKQADLFLSKSNVYKEYTEKYENELVNKIIATNKPELITGWLTTGVKSSNAEERLMTKTLSELNPKVLGQVRRKLIEDIFNQTLHDAKDPVLQGVQGSGKRYGGDAFIKNLNKVGSTKLEAILGPEAFKNLEEFTKLTATINTGKPGGGVGRFLNLLFLLPFKGGLKVDTLTKTGTTAFVLNRAAKFITNTDGMRIYESYIKAMGQHSPRLVNLAIDEIRKYNQRSDEEYEREHMDADIEYEKLKTQEKK